MPTVQAGATLSPGEQYLHALWRGRWLFLTIVAGFVAGSLIVTVLLPTEYASKAVLSVRPAPQLEPAAALYGSAMIQTTKGDDFVEQGPRRFVKRFEANSVVTAAAREAGVIAPTATIDDRQIRNWLIVENVEKTDLLSLSVSQPTAEGARRFALALVAHASEASRSEATPDPATRQFLEQERHRAAAAMQQAENAVVQAVSAAAPAGAARDIALERAKLELSLARDQYAAVRKRLSLLDLIVANQQFQVTVVDPPTLPVRPSFPRPLLNVSIGLILGVLGATTFIVLRSALQGR